MPKTSFKSSSKSEAFKVTFSHWRSKLRGEAFLAKNAAGTQSGAHTCSASGKLKSSDDKNKEDLTIKLNHTLSTKATTRDLWAEAFEKLSPQVQTQIREFGYLPEGSKLQREDIETLLHEFQRKRQICEQQSWKYKTERHEIIVRDYAAKCVAWVQKVGDLIVPFAPSPVAGPWGLVKAILQVPASFAGQMLAVLGTLEKVLQIIHHGRVYESVYTAGQIPEPLLSMLQRDLIKLYTATLGLLSHCTDLLSRPVLKPLLSQILYPDKTSGLSSDVANCEADLAKTIQICESQRSIDTNETITKLLHATHAPLVRIETQVTSHLAQIDKAKALEMLEWISPVPYGKHHAAVKSERVSNTGDWLLQDGRFRDWEESSSSAVLWLRGSPGVGKTFLTSRVVDHIQKTLVTVPNHEGFAFFYCNHSDHLTTQPLSVAHSYIRQLSTTAQSERGYIQTSLQETYDQSRSKGAHLDRATCKKLLLDSLNLYPRTTLVLDALDECEPRTRGILIDLFEDLLCNSTRPVKLFIASRPDGDIRRHFRFHSSIEIQSNDNHKDIENYIRQKLPQLAEENNELRDLQPLITSKLLELCQGMFQWTFLQLEQLRECVSREAILECLGTLPRTLEAAYDNIYTKIAGSQAHDRDLANRAFMWVLAAARPLHRVELLQAIRIDPDRDALDLCAAISEDSLQSLCRNLLVLDSEGVWRISHLSVAEYFESRHDWTSNVTNVMASKVCLLLLLDAPHLLQLDETSFVNNDEANTTEISTYDDNFFHEYLPYYWPIHIRIAERGGVTALAPVTTLLERFLGYPYESSGQYRIWLEEIARSGRMFGTVFYPGTILPPEVSILAACKFGFNLSLGRWWDLAVVDHTRTNVFGQTPLTIAVCNGHDGLCRTLLRKGADPHSPQGDAEVTKLTPLISAVINDCFQGVQFLVREAHVDVNTQLENATYPCALDAAISRGKSEIMRFLIIDAKADVNIQLKHGRYGSCLAHAAAELPLDTVKFLVEEGKADVNLPLRHGLFGSALTATVAPDPMRMFRPKSRRQNQSTVEYLVEKCKADVNMALPTGKYNSALEAAAINGVGRDVEYLVKVGKARINMPLLRSRHGSALSAAAYNGHKDIVRFLLDAGASIMLDLGNGRTANAVTAVQTPMSEEDHKDRFLIIYGHISEMVKEHKAEIAALLENW